MRQNAPELQWCIKHLGSIVLSRKEELDNVNTLPENKKAEIPLLCSRRTHGKKKKGGGVTLSHSRKSCAAVSDEQQKLVANLKGQCAVCIQPPLFSKAYNKKQRGARAFP